MEEKKETIETVESPSILEETKALVEEMKKQNELKAELLDREEKLQSFKMLGGKSEVKTKEEKEVSPKEYVEKIMNGN